MNPTTTPQHLVALAIGPVQSFIEAARRTRDLWAGSQLLSQLAAGLAAQLHNAGATPMFPGRQPPRAAGSIVVSNKVLVSLPSAQVAQAMADAEAWLRGELQRVGRELFQQLDRRGLSDAVDGRRWCDQWADAVQLVWAACPLTPPQSYAQVYQQTQALLDDCKRTRLFAAAPSRQGSLQQRLAMVAPPVSSLGGLQESVLVEGAALDRLRRRYQINRGEALDALGLYKRAGAAQSFPSVARVALQPWVKQLTADQRRTLAAALEPLTPDDVGLARRYTVAAELANGCTPDLPPTVPQPLADLAFDFECVLPTRRADMARENPGQAHLLGPLGTVLHGLPRLPNEGPYVCTLAADGDRMGVWLASPAMKPPAHAAVSAALEDLARDVPALCAHHGGASIYAGGDDVLAIVSVDEAVPLARRLADEFCRRMQAVAQTHALPTAPTLSVGLAFTHVLQPTGQARRLARQALMLAKQGPDKRGLRNALGLLAAPRGGAPVALAGQWASPAEPGKLGLDERLACWREAFAAGTLSQSAGYDLAQLVRSSPVNALGADALRLVGRRLNGTARDALLALVTDQSEERDGHWQRLAQELYLARWLNRCAAPPPVAANPDQPPDAGEAQAPTSHVVPAIADTPEAP